MTSFVVTRTGEDGHKNTHYVTVTGRSLTLAGQMLRPPVARCDVFFSIAENRTGFTYILALAIDIELQNDPYPLFYKIEMATVLPIKSDISISCFRIGLVCSTRG